MQLLGAAFILALSATTASAYQGMPCSSEGTATSPGSTDPVVLELTNDGVNPATLFWIDFSGQRKQYGVIQPKAKFRQETFRGHIWMVALGSQCHMMFAANNNPDTMWFSVDALAQPGAIVPPTVQP